MALLVADSVQLKAAVDNPDLYSIWNAALLTGIDDKTRSALAAKLDSIKILSRQKEFQTVKRVTLTVECREDTKPLGSEIEGIVSGLLRYASIDVVTDPAVATDGAITIALQGRAVAGAYSGHTKCYNGYSFSGSVAYYSKGRLIKTVPFSESYEPQFAIENCAESPNSPSSPLGSNAKRAVTGVLIKSIAAQFGYIPVVQMMTDPDFAEDAKRFFNTSPDRDQILLPLLKQPAIVDKFGDKIIEALAGCTSADCNDAYKAAFESSIKKPVFSAVFKALQDPLGGGLPK